MVCAGLFGHGCLAVLFPGPLWTHACTRQPRYHQRLGFRLPVLTGYRGFPGPVEAAAGRPKNLCHGGRRRWLLGRLGRDLPLLQPVSLDLAGRAGGSRRLEWALPGALHRRHTVDCLGPDVLRHEAPRKALTPQKEWGPRVRLLLFSFPFMEEQFSKGREGQGDSSFFPVDFDEAEFLEALIFFVAVQVVVDEAGPQLQLLRSEERR